MLCLGLISGCGSSQASSTAASAAGQSIAPAASNSAAPAATETASAAEAISSASAGTEPIDTAAPAGAEGISDETLRVVYDSEPPFLNTLWGPYGNSLIQTTRLMGNFLLVKNPETGGYDPEAATDWEWLDETHLQVKLRDDIVAPDGTIYDANDLHWNVTELGPLCQNVSLWQYLDYDECKVVDDFTYIFGFINPYPTYVDLLGGLYLLPLNDKSSVEAAGGWEVAGPSFLGNTGKYDLDEWVSGSHIRLVRNEDYWGELPYYKYIEITFVSDAASRALSLQSGDVDVACSLTSNECPSLESDPNVTVFKSLSDTANVGLFNCSREPFTNEKVREALCYAVDLNTVIQAVTAGDSEIAYTLYAPQNSVFCVPDNLRTQDMEKAKQLLTEAGYGPGDIHFTISSSISNQLYAEILQAFWQEIGVTAEIELVDNNAQGTILGKGDYDFYFLGGLGYDPARLALRLDSRLSVEMRNGGPQIDSTEINDVLDKAYYSVDESARLDAYHEIQNYIYDHCLGTGGYTGVMYYGLSSKLTGARVQNEGILYIDELRPAQ